MASTDGSGATLSFTGLTGDITGFSWSGMTREEIDATHLGSTDIKDFISARLYDGGEISVELNVDANPTAPLTTYARQGGSLVFTFLDSSEGTVTCSIPALCTACDPITVGNDEDVTASATFKVRGAPVWS